MAVFNNSYCNNEKTDNFSLIQENLSKKVFPNFYRIVQVSNILPISSATSDHAFSATRRISTYLRSTMEQHRFSNLSILNIENDVEIDPEIILEQFTAINKRKMNLI